MADHLCPSYEICQAPLCPKLPHQEGSWFPDEAVCKARGLKCHWLQIQKRIAKRTHQDHSRGYFTVPMLNSIGAVSPKIQGCDPNLPPDQQEDSWISKRHRTHSTGRPGNLKPFQPRNPTHTHNPREEVPPQDRE